MTEEIKTEATTPQPKKPTKKPLRTMKHKSRTVEKQLSVQAKQITALAKDLSTVKEQLAAVSQVVSQLMAAARGSLVPTDPQASFINARLAEQRTPPVNKQLSPVINKQPPVPSRPFDPQEFRINSRMRAEIDENLTREKRT
jgi:small-conductance mechanosensitive channel